MKRALVLLFSAAVLWAQGLSPRQWAALEEALQTVALTPQELGFRKALHHREAFRYPRVEFLLQNPLAVPAYAESLKTHAQVAFDEPFSEALLAFTRLVAGEAGILREELPASGRPRDPHKALALLVQASLSAKSALEEALSGLSPEARDSFRLFLPILWSDEDDSLDDTLKGYFHRAAGEEADTTPEFEEEAFFRLLQRIDPQTAFRGAFGVLAALVRSYPALAGWSFPEDADTLEVEGVTGGVLYHEITPVGEVVVGGPGPNTYNRDFFLILDLGGDDRYRNRGGGGSLFLGLPVSIVLDLGGNDRYETPDLPAQGAGVFGVGVLLDTRGHDRYLAGPYAQGVGLFGLGLLLDLGGEDTYRAGYFAQGAGNFGVGILCDTEGDETYRIYDWGQGFGSTWGFGLLYDRMGDDLYYAGAHYPHYPLHVNHFRSFAQGFGMGWRDFAWGGIGFLLDGQGNDQYLAEIYGQGTSYWYSIGLLVDEAGSDNYYAIEYAQGAGIHLTVGGLFDLEGNDAYFSRYGPSQGEGHDLSVGFLVDQKGEDRYFVSGGLGVGLTNSVGIFLDGEGNDTYTSTELNLAQGGANVRRGFGGIGVFLDLGGRDIYNKGAQGADGMIWTKGLIGVGMDLMEEGLGKAKGKAPEVPFRPPLGASGSAFLRGSEAFEPLKGPLAEAFDSLPDTLRERLARLFEEASEWNVGAAREKVKKAREALVELGEPTVAYLFGVKIATPKHLEIYAVRDILKQMADSLWRPALLRALQDTADRIRRNAIFLAAELKVKEALPVVTPYLHAKDASDRARGAYAIGAIGDTTYADSLIPLLKDRDDHVRVRAVVALNKLKAGHTLPALLGALRDPMFTVRYAVERGLAGFGSPALDSLLVLLEKRGETQVLYHALRAVGYFGDSLTGTPRVRSALAAFLEHKDPRLRAAAAESLGKIGLGEGLRTHFRYLLEVEPHPLVRGKLQEALQK